VFLGDYIDRGPDTRGCIDAILRFTSQVDADVVSLIGNHEDWFLRTVHDYNRHSWLLGMEPFPTIRSYSAEAAVALHEALKEAGPALYEERRALPYELFFDHVPADHIRFFESLRQSHRTDDCLCVHGGVDVHVPDVKSQTRDALIWGRGDFPDGYMGADIVVYGHRNNAVLDADGWPMPRIVGRTIGLDTISHGVLTAMRLPDQRIYQSARYRFAES
jgi:diadenosine tetraphosphatase ApaH/serine/threonine PP2A family protein phosphatase